MMNKLIETIKACNDFLIVSHISPDGDTLGSAAALYLAIKAMGKEAVLALEGTVPKKLSFLNEFCSFLKLEELPKREFECGIAVDIATVRRMGNIAGVFLASSNKLNIDHHATNERYGDHNLIEEKASTGEIMLNMIEGLGVEVSVDMANSLYAAVSTDTNNFVYSNVQPETFETAARLLKYGAKTAELCDMIYYRRSFGATKLIALALSRLKLYHDGKISALYMTLDDIKKCGAKREDCDVLVNYAREIDGVEIAVFVNEMPDGKYKVSLRSNQYADVSAISVKYGGGGHKKASGHVMDGNVEKILEEIIEEAEKSIV